MHTSTDLLLMIGIQKRSSEVGRDSSHKEVVRRTAAAKPANVIPVGFRRFLICGEAAVVSRTTGSDALSGCGAK